MAARAATGLRPAGWLALEWRDLDLEARVVYVHRSFTKGRLKCPKTAASRRAVPLQTIALEAIKQQPASRQSGLVFPPSGAATSTCTTSATASGSPRSSLPGSSRDAGSTISDTPSPPSRSCWHLHLRPLPLHGRQPDHDRPPLRPPRPRRARARHSPARRAERGTTSTVDTGGRCVDAKDSGRRQQDNGNSG